MSSLVFSLLAAVCTATASLFFRKNASNADYSSSSSGYLVIFYAVSFISSLIFFPSIWEVDINFIILAIGACVGLMSSTLMLWTSHALRQGPAGLTFAFQNASAIFPGLILFLLLGEDFGFSSSLLQLLGMVLVIGGLFLGTKQEFTVDRKVSHHWSKWLKYALACFIIQILALTCMEARCLLFNLDEIGGFFSNFAAKEAEDVWFMPGQFGASFGMQALIFLREKRKVQTSEAIYGCLGGIANFGSTGLLLLATKLALPLEKGIIFPCFAVTSMILCNVWANRLYQEKFNFKSNVLCSFGIFMAVSG